MAVIRRILKICDIRDCHACISPKGKQKNKLLEVEGRHVRNFLSPEFLDKVPEGSALISGDNLISF